MKQSHAVLQHLSAAHPATSCEYEASLLVIYPKVTSLHCKSNNYVAKEFQRRLERLLNCNIMKLKTKHSPGLNRARGFLSHYQCWCLHTYYLSTYHIDSIYTCYCYLSANDIWHLKSLRFPIYRTGGFTF